MNKIIIAKKELKNLYQDRKLSSYAIAKIYNCNPSVIQNRLREYDIKPRDPKKRIDISKTKLEELYLQRKLSTYKIAKIIKCKSNNTVSRKLKEHGIKARHIKKVPITKEELYELYHIKKLPLSKIAKKFSCTTTIIFRRMKDFDITSRNSSEANTIYPKKNFSNNLVEKAYLIGFRLGDLNVKASGSLIHVKSNTTKKDQVNLFVRLFRKYGHVNVKKTNNNFHHAVSLNKSFNFLISKEDNIQSWILNDNKSFFSFLAGYTDAEGNIGVYNNQARFRIRTYDKNIIKQIQERLKIMEINAKYNLESLPKKGFQNKISWCVSVNTKQDLQKLFKLLKPHIKHAKRFKDLIIAENNIKVRLN